MKAHLGFMIFLFASFLFPSTAHSEKVEPPVPISSKTRLITEKDMQYILLSGYGYSNLAKAYPESQKQITEKAFVTAGINRERAAKLSSSTTKISASKAVNRFFFAGSVIALANKLHHIYEIENGPSLITHISLYLSSIFEEDEKVSSED
jgi:hypothetical protein